MSGLSDSSQRPINYLRISVTDRCNLRCIYCMPAGGVPLLPRDHILSYEEIQVVTQVAAELGITKVRLSGGEPLMRSGLTKLVAMLKKIETIDDISLTTNGTLLKEHASELKEAGLRRVNISLDTLKRDRYQHITGEDKLNQVLSSINKAKSVGLHPIKINTVVMRGINDDELLDFAAQSLEEDWHVRFIELMPFGKREERFVPVQEMKQRIAALGELEPYPSDIGNGPARYFRLPRSQGTIGFITPVSEHFCFRCNRLRLMADGRLRPCLLSDIGLDLRGPLRDSASVEEIKHLFQEAAAAKPLHHHLAQGFTPEEQSMSQVGG